MEMLRHSSACGRTFVEPNVESLRVQAVAYETACTFDERPKSGSLLLVVIEQRGCRFTERDKQMAVGIGISIEQDHALIGTQHDMVLQITRGVFVARA